MIMTSDSKVSQSSVCDWYSSLSRWRSIELIGGFMREGANHLGKDITRGWCTGALLPIVRSNRVSTWGRCLVHWTWWRRTNMKSIRLEWSPCLNVGCQWCWQWTATKSRSRIMVWKSCLSHWVAWPYLGLRECTWGASAVRDVLQSPARSNMWLFGTWWMHWRMASKTWSLSWRRVGRSFKEF